MMGTKKEKVTKKLENFSSNQEICHETLDFFSITYYFLRQQCKEHEQQSKSHNWQMQKCEGKEQEIALKSRVIS